MRIALLAPLVAPIAPPYLGGAQALIADLAAGLATRGHHVTLYAADGSHVPGVTVPPLGINSAQLQPARFADPADPADPADRAPTAPPSTATDEDADDPLPAEPDAFQATDAFTRAYRAIAANAKQHDLLHAHAYDQPAFALATSQPLLVVHTLHLPAVDPAINRTLAHLAPPAPTPSSPALPRAPRLVTVSHACAATYAAVCHIDAVIYNGIEIARIPFGARPADPPYLLFAGRITPEKGVDDAIEIARATGRPLRIAGGIYDRDYYDTRVAPLLTGNPGTNTPTTTYLGPLDREPLWQLMSGAEAVLCPVHWDEPFGLVAAEAQAAGAPVIGYARGGLTEVVEHGTTGFLLPPGDRAAAVVAVQRLATLDRAACRARVEQRFSLSTMLDAYEALYADLLR